MRKNKVEPVEEYKRLNSDAKKDLINLVVVGHGLAHVAAPDAVDQRLDEALREDAAVHFVEAEAESVIHSRAGESPAALAAGLVRRGFEYAAFLWCSFLFLGTDL